MKDPGLDTGLDLTLESQGEDKDTIKTKRFLTIAI